MSKHTPGPWEVDGWNIFSGNLYIAEASVYDVGPVQTAANARLMAAAPDMYEELAHLVRLLEPLENDGTLNVPGLATLNGARAALARADGE